MVRIRDEDGDPGWRIIIAAIVSALGAPLVWEVTHPDPPRSEQLPACAPGAGHPCAYLRADGTRMVRWVTTARGLEESTAAEYDEGHLDWLQEGAPACPGTGIGPSSGCWARCLLLLSAGCVVPPASVRTGASPGPD